MHRSLLGFQLFGSHAKLAQNRAARSWRQTSITWGVDGYVKARVFGDQPSPDVDGCVAVSGKVEGLNETRGHLWRECLSVPGLVVFCRGGSGILPVEHAAAHDLTGLPAAAGGKSVTSCPVVLDLVRDSSAAALRILRVRGVSMEPELRDGDGLVVKRVVPSPGTGTLTLVSANPDHPDYDRRADDVHIVGNVLWKLTRM